MNHLKSLDITCIVLNMFFNFEFFVLIDKNETLEL